MVGKKVVCALMLIVPLFGAAKPVPVADDLLHQATRFDSYGVSVSSCGDKLKEPHVPANVPSWATPAISKLRSTKTVKEVGEAGVFRKGDQIVIKKCTTAALEDVFEYIVPRPNRGTANLKCDIYFDCGNRRKYTIMVKKELWFGTQAQNTRGTFRMIAPKYNVELNGRKLNRILKVQRHATVTLSGLQFKDGRMIDMKTSIDKAPAGGWSGAAVLASYRSNLVVHKCRFYNNHSRSLYVRLSSGGAIMAETRSKVHIWGSLFEGNVAANGGAVASSSALELYVVKSTFLGNIARGGFDMSKKKKINGKVKPTLQVRGGAMRIDSVTGHAKNAEHVFLCNTKFSKNMIRMSDSDLKSFGYKPSEATHMFTGASAIETWNKPGTLDLKKGDTNLITMRGCVFHGNSEQLPWQDRNYGIGRYVFEARGTGNMDLEDSKFTGNKVAKAVVGVDNSDFFKEHNYKLKMKGLNGSNGAIPTVRFASKYRMRCVVKRVDGMRDGSGDCRELQVNEG